MAITQLNDVIVPDVFAAYMLKETMVKSAIFESGVLRPDAKLASDLAGGGTTFQVPFWKDLADTEATVATDQTTDTITAMEITASKMRAIRQYRAAAWSDADLVSALAGSDPMVQIGNLVSGYWRRGFQDVLINTLRGVFADNIANDSSDMVYDATTLSVDTTDPITHISADTIIEAKQTLGDASDSLALIVMHSRLYSNLQKQNLID